MSSRHQQPVQIPVFHPDHPHNRSPFQHQHQHQHQYHSQYQYQSQSQSQSPQPIAPAVSTSPVGASGNPPYPYPLAPSHLNIPDRRVGPGPTTTPSSGSGSKMAFAFAFAQPQMQSQSQPASAYEIDSGMSDSDASSSSPGTVRRRCFCGREVEVVEGEAKIYCSIDCARSDAFTSLCYKPNAPAPVPTRQDSATSSSSATTSIASAISSSLSRNTSASSVSTSTSTSASTSTSYDAPEWTASHYRRLARADLRREERREERRRRRADGSSASSSVSVPSTSSRSTVMSSSSATSSRVPDLVGGHSRNPSTASTASSAWSGSALSRNPSSASNTSMSSRRGYGGGVKVDAVIMEDDDEEEWLQDTRPYAPPPKKGHRRRPSASASASQTGHHSRRKLEPIGMGKDMRDVLEEIIQMEKIFVVDDMDGDDSHPQPGPFTAAFDRPPRTPSPSATERQRMSIIPLAPGAPVRGHRTTLSNPLASPQMGNHRRPRPPSSIPMASGGMHQSSLSESHTALYLATASPVQSGRRSASPKLRARQSLTFTPEAAGPSILGLPLPASNRFDSPSGSGSLTPSRRRLNTSPAHHPTMDHWRFPSLGTSVNATPTRPVLPPINTSFGNMTTPTHRSGGGAGAGANPQSQPRTQPSLAPSAVTTMAERIQPHLLWPQPPNLAPSLFPSSPATGTPEFIASTSFPRHHTRSNLSPTGASPEVMMPPNSGLRLGVLLGSGNGEGGEQEQDVESEMDVEMEMDEDGDGDDGSTAHGHGLGPGSGGLPRERGSYFPVFLEAEGFMPAQRAPWFA